jgi:DNA polymerase
VQDDPDRRSERKALLRSLRHLLESLRRAGVEWIPAARGGHVPPPAGVAASQSVMRQSPPPASERAARATAPQVVDRPAPIPAKAQPVAPQPAFGTHYRVPNEDRSGTKTGYDWPAHPAESVSPPVRLPLTLPLAPVAPPVKSPVTLPLAASGSLFGASDFDIPPVPASDRPAILASLASEVSVCRRCSELAETRTQTVFGVGTPEARLMFIGEAPGGEEDRQGEPFVGRAGQLLTDMITKGMGLARNQVYIANILKCRPPENRTPSLEECVNCVGYLEQQIAIIRPEFICMLGLVAAQTLLETTQSLGRLRGRWHTYRGIRTIVTYHPAYLLRSPAFKKQAWEDLQTLMKAMGLPLPKSRGRLEG